MFREKALLLAYLALLFALVACGGDGDDEEENARTTGGQTACEQTVTQAIALADDVCSSVDANSACYGHEQIVAELRAGSDASFAEGGDTVSLASLAGLQTAPLDEANDIWGVAVIKAQADLPGTLPGQLVTFVLLGDTNLSDVSEDLSVFTLSTGLGAGGCEALPESSLLIQSPEDENITLTVNGAQVTLGSTTVITSIQNSQMIVANLEGSVGVESQQVSQTTQPGFQVRVPLGGSSGLEAAGPPSPPEPITIPRLQALPITPPEQPITIPIVPTATITPLASPTLTLTPTLTPTATSVPTDTPPPP